MSNALHARVGVGELPKADDLTVMDAVRHDVDRSIRLLTREAIRRGEEVDWRSLSVTMEHNAIFGLEVNARAVTR